MAKKAKPNEFVGLLGLFKSGELTLSVRGNEALKLDAKVKSVTLDVGAIESLSLGKALSESLDLSVASSIGAARALAKAGWELELSRDGKEVARLGRGVSALTGHIRGSLRELLSLRRSL